MPFLRRDFLKATGTLSLSVLGIGAVHAATSLPEAPQIKPIELVDCEYPVFELKGTSYERGLTYGRTVTEAIKRNISFYEMIFKTFANVPWSKAKALSKRFVPYIEKYCPYAIDEMKGIAEGSGIDFDDILTLNCRSEAMFAASDGCTAVAFIPEQTHSSEVLMGQTWDWFMPARENTCILKIYQQDMPDILMVAEAGLIGGKGLNSLGLGLLLNAVSVGKGKPGLPLHLIMRNILNSTLPTEALDCVAHVPRAGSGTLTVGYAEGYAMCIEFSPDNFDVFMAEEKPLVHTNHFLSPLIAPFDTGKAGPLSTYTRLNTISRKIAGAPEPQNAQDIFTLLTSHELYPESLCYHEDVRDKGLRACTIYSLAMNLNKRELLISNGYPCEGRVSIFSF